MSKYENAIKLMEQKFSQDSLISVATMAKSGKSPEVRIVDAYYEDGAFYAVTYTLSNKMREIEQNNAVAVCGDWFKAKGTGENLGWVMEERNAEMMSKLRKAFSKWYTMGHVNEKDPNTCLLKIKLSECILADHERTYGDDEYKINFLNKTVQELSVMGDFQIIDLPDENRTGVMEIKNPQGWAVTQYNLGAYKDKNVTVKFSVDIKRVGAAGDLNWQVNNNDYPSVGNSIENAAENTWHTMSGEWTGTPTVDYPALYLSTHGNNSKETIYYIDKFSVEIN
ncbi:MAG: pyridoxamine 5'-phosphate oxidase family protein [Oscillospiraceae bacterium]|nr:pyridoxamine 5'-phosphate oxidase family protein [Oscillospiraceae bacterium]